MVECLTGSLGLVERESISLKSISTSFSASGLFNRNRKRKVVDRYFNHDRCNFKQAGKAEMSLSPSQN